jgi:hypothetical protein
MFRSPTKLLQVVNSATYGQFGGRVRTVSKAVLILGGEIVRNVAMTLMMLEFSRGAHRRGRCRMSSSVRSSQEWCQKHCVSGSGFPAARRL